MDHQPVIFADGSYAAIGTTTLWTYEVINGHALAFRHYWSLNYVAAGLTYILYIDYGAGNFFTWTSTIGASSSYGDNLYIYAIGPCTIQIDAVATVAGYFHANFGCELIQQGELFLL